MEPEKCLTVEPVPSQLNPINFSSPCFHKVYFILSSHLFLDPECLWGQAHFLPSSYLEMVIKTTGA